MITNCNPKIVGRERHQRACHPRDSNAYVVDRRRVNSTRSASQVDVMKKILVIGPGGAGKLTFATQLGELLGLEVIHLDARYWKAGWVEPAKKEWSAVIETLVEHKAWVMDGNYSGTLQTRLRACDALVFLDLPRLTCIWRGLRRAIRYPNSTRTHIVQGRSVTL